MRALERNKRPFYYALYTGKTPVVDANDMKTGEYTVSYSDPVQADMNVSAARGVADLEQFGVDVQYSHTACTCDMSCPIDTHSIIWYGADPNTDAHNYVVVRVARSLNSIVYALQEVNVS